MDQIESSVSQAPAAARPRLSCERCTQRKVKCDKLKPCSTCQRDGVTCVAVERRRLPRGKHQIFKATSNQNKRSELSGDLRDRLSKLESLVQSLVPEAAAGEQASQTKSLGKSSISGSSDETSSPPAYLGHPFWSDLIHETRGLREILEKPTDDDDRGFGQNSDVHAQLLGMIGSSADPATFVEGLGQNSPGSIQKQLCQGFLEQVDPVFKMLHRPSVTAHLMDGKRYLNYDLDHPSSVALDYAIFYAAVASMTEERSMFLFQTKKESVIARYRLACEAGLARVDFVMTDDLTVLQAYTIFLIATRLHDRSRRVWTMLSLAVRIGQSLSLHADFSAMPIVRPFEREMRRRVWFAIGLLDMQAALERASEPMITESWLDASRVPKNVNDSDFSFDYEGELIETTGFTDMTYGLMTHKAQCVGRLLNFPLPAGDPSGNWYIRQQHVEDFRQGIFSLLQGTTPESENVPFCWFTRTLAKILIATMQLISIRPVRQPPCEPPPHIKTFNVLKLSIDVIQKTQGLVQDSRITPWKWAEAIFVPWHALAVALAELCVCDDVSLLEAYLPTLEYEFSRQSGLVSNSDFTLWGPIEKLMSRAQEKMKHVLDLREAKNRSFAGNSSAQPSMVDVDSMDVLLPTSLRSLDLTIDGSSPGSVSYNDLQFWPNLEQTIEFFGTTSANMADTAAWANWESFVNDLNTTEDVPFSFGGYGQ